MIRHEAEENLKCIDFCEHWVSIVDVWSGPIILEIRYDLDVFKILIKSEFLLRLISCSVMVFVSYLSRVLLAKD